MSSLEWRCRRLLRAYPAGYRRGRGGEMLDTLLEASPPGRRRPSLRGTRALVIGGLRVRGWTWLLTMLWVAAGAVSQVLRCQRSALLAALLWWAGESWRSFPRGWCSGPG